MIDLKKECRVSVRVSEDDCKYLRVLASMCGMSMSQYVRSLVSSSIAAAKVSEKRGTLRLADFETVLNDKL